MVGNLSPRHLNDRPGPARAMSWQDRGPVSSLRPRRLRPRVHRERGTVPRELPTGRSASSPPRPLSRRPSPTVATPMRRSTASSAATSCGSHARRGARAVSGKCRRMRRCTAANRLAFVALRRPLMLVVTSRSANIPAPTRKPAGGASAIPEFRGSSIYPESMPNGNQRRRYRGNSKTRRFKA